MLAFNMFFILSCTVVVCMAELRPKEEVRPFADEVRPPYDESIQLEREKKVEDNNMKLDETAPQDVRAKDAIEMAQVGDALELADPMKNVELKESIQSALTGYDVVIGDPINVVNSGTVRDKGIKQHIFEYVPNDPKKLLQVSPLSGCSGKIDAEVINTVGKYREQLDKEAKVSGSVSGSGFGVSASFSFSASTSSNEVKDFIANKKGSLTIFSMTCSSRHLQVGNTMTGLPPFTWKFANFVVNSLGTVPTGNSYQAKQKQKEMFKHLIVNYGTDYIKEATIGARVTTTNFLSQTMTSTQSQKKIKNCASASAKVSYGMMSANVDARGCSASDRSKFDSNDVGITKIVKNSYGTTKVAGDGTKFGMDQMKEPRPIGMVLETIIALFEPEALKYGIPEDFGACGKNADPTGSKRKELSKNILSWLKPMFATDKFQDNYCNAFKRELPDCGKTLTTDKTKNRGCGISGACDAFEKCVTTSAAPYYRCDKVGAERFIGKMVHIGYGSACYLYWRGGRGNTHNGEFRCNQDGNKDTFWIKSAGKSKNNDQPLYKIGYGNCPMYWASSSSNTKNVEFRCGSSGDTFWISEITQDYGPNKLYTLKKGWAIGYSQSKTSICPMFWRGGDRNAEMRCDRNIQDTFWIRPVSQGDEPVEQDEPVLKRDEPVFKRDEPVLKRDEPVLKQSDPVDLVAEEFKVEDDFEEEVL